VPNDESQAHSWGTAAASTASVAQPRRLERCGVLLSATRLVVTGLVVGLALAGCASTPGDDGLSGRLVGVDDAGGGDHDLGGGWVVAVPEDRSDELWSPQGRPDDLAHARVELDESALSALGGARAEVTDSGGFRLDAPAGPALVCWEVPTERDDLMRSRGCHSLDVPADGSLRATWGEGGFFVEAGR